MNSTEEDITSNEGDMAYLAQILICCVLLFASATQAHVSMMCVACIILTNIVTKNPNS